MEAPAAREAAAFAGRWSRMPRLPKRQCPSQHLVPPVSADAHPDDHGYGCDAMILPNLHIGGVDPHIGQFNFGRPLQEVLQPLVDILAEHVHLAFGDARDAHALRRSSTEPTVMPCM